MKRFNIEFHLQRAMSTISRERPVSRNTGERVVSVSSLKYNKGVGSGSRRHEEGC